VAELSEILDHRVRPAAGEPEGALVLIHGRGADEHDLFGLLDALDPERRLLGLTPGGPLALPPGGRHWYQLGGIPTPEPTTFHGAVDLLARFLAAVPFTPDRVVLGGFSQGCVMTWSLALGPGRPAPAGVIGISGFLPQVTGFPLDPARLAGVPTVVAHGALDPVIPASFGRAARDALVAAGARPVWLESPVPHMVDHAWIEPMRQVVRAAIP
jgi:phospholipase/carboxylesterase